MIFSGDIGKLDSPRRRELLPPEKVLAMAGVKPGDIVTDFGCGIGYMTIPASDIVGDEGRIIAIDISEKMLEELRQRAGDRRNIIMINSSQLAIPSDVILLVNVLHEIPDPEAFLSDSFDTLKPGGRLVIVDWEKRQTSMGPPVQERLSKEEILRMAARPAEQHSFGGQQYLLIFR